KTEEPKAQEENAPTAAETTEESVDNSDVIATPAARKLAREKGIDLSKVVAQDPLGRIRPEDVEAAANAPKSAPAAPKADAPNAADQYDKPVRVEKMTRRRQTIAKRLVEAQHNAAMSKKCNKINKSRIMNVRNK